MWANRPKCRIDGNYREYGSFSAPFGSIAEQNREYSGIFPQEKENNTNLLVFMERQGEWGARAGKLLAGPLRWRSVAAWLRAPPPAEGRKAIPGVSSRAGSASGFRIFSGKERLARNSLRVSKPSASLAFRHKFLRNGSRSCWQGCARLREESASEFNTIRDPRLEFKLRKTA